MAPFDAQGLRAGARSTNQVQDAGFRDFGKGRSRGNDFGQIGFYCTGIGSAYPAILGLDFRKTVHVPQRPDAKRAKIDREKQFSFLFFSLPALVLLASLAVQFKIEDRITSP
jgi:hypothetical protein